MIDILTHTVLAISAALFDGLWEGVLIAGVVWLGLRSLPHLGAATRYVVWLFTLAALVAIPLLTIAFPRQYAAEPVTYGVVTYVTTAAATHNAPVAPAPRPSLTEAAPAPAPPLTQQVTVSAALPLGATLLWLLLACIRMALLALNLLDLARIRRGATIWSGAHDYPVYVSGNIDVPLAVGFIRPCVLIPTQVIEQQPPAALEAIIIHELAHLHRGDVWTNAFARATEALVALNPVVWFVLRRLSVEREIACDDWVVERLGTGDVFARALATMASYAGARSPLAAPSAIGSKHSVVVRIEELLDAHPRRLRLSLSALGGTLMVFAIIAMIFQTISPVLAYANEQRTPEIASSCTTPNHGVLMEMTYYTHDTVKHDWVPLPTANGYLAAIKRGMKTHPGWRSASVATADVTFDEIGRPTRIGVVSAPNGPDIDARVKRSVARYTYKPALVNCKAIAATVRTVIIVAVPVGARTQSNVAAVYPAGWSVQHPSACKVPNLVHDGAPALADSENLPALTASVLVNVDATGAVTHAAIDRSSGQPAFDNAVLSAARAATYPLGESSGFKPVRPDGATLAWNEAHGYNAYSKCSPLPTEYLWTSIHTPSRIWKTP